MNQCFIISLPRAGSTLLQRLLAAHPRIKTVGEPWAALPFVYALREDGARAEYGHHSLARGLGEFVETVGGQAAWLREGGEMLARLQRSLADAETEWFLDKTPRYYLILDELAQMFPSAKFVVLHRNPLAVVASILNTWHHGKFKAGTNEMDIYEGPRRIAAFVQARRENVLEVSYEALVMDAAAHVRRITDFLGVPALEKISLEGGDVLKESKLGDKTGIHRYSEVSAASVESWKSAFASPIRKRWAAHYLRWLGDETLGALGYKRDALLGELRSAPVSLRQAASDLLDCHFRVLSLCAPRVDFVARRRCDTRLRYRWKPRL
jgi:hypothetical protein